MPPSLEERIAAAVREPVAIAPYDPHWPQQFAAEVQFLREHLPSSLLGRIEHFGSTAVPGLAAKPVVDMLIEVSSLTATQQTIVPLLEAAGYDYFWRTDVDPPYAWLIKRHPNGQRSHHLHLVEAASALWDRLYFRDYLRDFPQVAERYVALKIDLAARFPSDRIAYTQGKSEFVSALTTKAKRWYRQPQ